jgi:hypothetical protein
MTLVPGIECWCAVMSSEVYSAEAMPQVLKGQNFIMCGLWTQDWLLQKRCTATLLKREAPGAADDGVGYLIFKGSGFYYDFAADAFVFPSPQVPHTKHTWFHKGFHMTCVSLESAILEAVGVNNIRSVVTTGHSLGGALAGTFAILHPELVTHAITFGATKFLYMNDETKMSVEWPFHRFEHTMKHYVYENDPVPRILGRYISFSTLFGVCGLVCSMTAYPWIKGYVGIGERIYINEGGDESPYIDSEHTLENASDILNHLSDHKIDGYVSSVCASKKKSETTTPKQAMSRRRASPQEPGMEITDEGEPVYVGGTLVDPNTLRSTRPFLVDVPEPVPKYDMLKFAKFRRISGGECDYYEKAECAKHANECEWEDSVIDVGFCRPKVEERAIKAAIAPVAEVMRQCSSIMGYMPTVGDMERVCATTFLGTVKGTMQAIIQNQQKLGNLLLPLLFQLSAYGDGSWRRTVGNLPSAIKAPSPNDPEGKDPASWVNIGGCMEFKEKLPMGERSISFGERNVICRPGDLITFGYHTGGGGNSLDAFQHRRIEYTFRSAVFLGKLPAAVMNSLFKASNLPQLDKAITSYNMCLLADGEKLHSTGNYLEMIQKTKENEYDTYYDLGYVRIISFEELYANTQYVEMLPPDAPRRDLAGIYSLGIGSIGVFTFTLDKSSSEQFAMYIVTGKWINTYLTDKVMKLQYAQPSATANVWYRYPKLRIDIPKLEWKSYRVPSPCVIVESLQCTSPQFRELYEQLKGIRVELKMERMQDAQLVAKINQKRAPPDVFEQQQGITVETLAAITARYTRALEDLRTVHREREAIADETEQELLKMLSEVVVLNSGKEYYCWDRLSLSRILMEQAEVNKEPPYDPVTLYPILAGSYKVITGNDLDYRLANRAEARVNWSGMDDATRMRLQRQARRAVSLPVRYKRLLAATPSLAWMPEPGQPLMKVLKKQKSDQPVAPPPYPGPPAEPKKPTKEVYMAEPSAPAAPAEPQKPLYPSNTTETPGATAPPAEQTPSIAPKN